MKLTNLPCYEFAIQRRIVSAVLQFGIVSPVVFLAEALR